jgi:hypothetical protein
MTLRLIINTTLAAMLMLTLQVTNVVAQSGSAAQDRSPKPYSIVSEETYNRVLDIVFPRDEFGSSKTIFAFVLRFKPYSQSESQVIIRRGAERIEVIEYTSLDGGIYIRLNELLARGFKEDAVELAKSIRVQRKAVSVPYAQIKRWYTSFFDSLTSTTKMLRGKGGEFDRTGGSETIFLHGAFYRLWYEQRLNQMSFSLYDVDIDDARTGSEFKLIHWMDMVRQEVEKLK